MYETIDCVMVVSYEGTRQENAEGETHAVSANGDIPLLFMKTRIRVIYKREMM